MNIANLPTYRLGRLPGKQGPRPPTVGNQARDYKSATRRPLSCKIDSLVSTSNIRSLNSSEKTGELTALAEGKGISAVCLQEHRKFHDTVQRTARMTTML